MQSERGKEEPDLMALDRDGKLFIFEIKVWEARSENLLQVLRYGQLFGPYDYERLNEIWQKRNSDGPSLLEVHQAKFEQNLRPEQFNRRQVFVVLTNGLDVDTRQAIRYWRSTKLDVRPWVYRAYQLDDRKLLEISPFRTEDDPLEDQGEGSPGEGFYIVNTNKRNASEDDEAMLTTKRVAAYFDPWKYKIARLKKSDTVFLYRSGQGIVAFGKADGKLKKSAYHGNPAHPAEEYSMGLLGFTPVTPPLSASRIKEITGRPTLVFLQTMFSLDPVGGGALLRALTREATT
jgi:ribosomal protein L39E